MRAPQPDPPSGSLFASLISRYRGEQGELGDIAREAQAVLDRYEADARDNADRLMIEARLEAARLLTDARRELDALNRQITALQEAQREASHTLEQTRRAVDAALGSMASGQRGAAAAGARRTAPPPQHVVADARGAKRPRGSGYVAPVLMGAVATLAVAALVWFVRPSLMPWLPPPSSVKERLREGSTRQVNSESSGQERPSHPEPVQSAARPDRTSVSSPITVTLEARRPSWVRATRDGAGEGGRVLRAGERRVITARHVSVRVGDAGAVLVSVDGSPVQPFGRDGQPATRVFGMREPPRPHAPLIASPSSARNAGRHDVVSPMPVAPTAGSSPVQTTELPTLTSGAVAVAPALPAVPAPPSTSDGVEAEILATDRQWFESFYRGDRTEMARLSAPGFELVDSRKAADRFAPGATFPTRTLRDIRVDVHGGGAVLSGRMIERSADGSREQESFVSEVWVKRDGVWRLLGLRLASAMQVRQAAGSLR